MNAKQAFRRAAHCLAGLNLYPGLHDRVQRTAGNAHIIPRQLAFSDPAHERGGALGTGAPPKDQGRIVVQQLPYGRGAGFLDAERHNRRRIPELHQPSSRSRVTAVRTAASESTGRGQSQKIGRQRSDGTFQQSLLFHLAQVLSEGRGTGDGKQPGDRAATLGNQDFLTRLDLSQVRTQRRLQPRHRGDFHNTTFLVKAIRPV